MPTSSKYDQALSLERQGRPADAERLYAEALADDPANAAAADRLGVLALAKQGPAAALAWFECALAIDPGLVAARLNAGLVLQQLGRPLDAEAAFRRAAADSPRFAAAHYLLAQCLWDRGVYDEACERFGQAISLGGEFAADYLSNQIARLNVCDWRGYQAAAALTTRLVRTGAAAPNPVNFMYTSDSAADQYQCARLTAARRYPARPPLWTAAQPRRPGKIRIGYVTSDFYDHAVAHVIAGVLENHDRDAFELTAFSYCPPYPSPIRDRIVASFDHFLNVLDLDDEAIARLIREKDIDILVSLSGYAYRARPQILAWRPAPVQVSWLGFPGALGAPYIDYLIADAHVIPPGETARYTEKIAWMPHSYQPTDDTSPRVPARSTRAQEGLPEKAVVLMAYNQPCKIAPATFAIWMRILGQVPKAVLWLSDGGEEAQGNLREEARARGVDPARLVFAPRIASREDHLARHHLADLFVDTLPYNAHSTASDALWAGLPVVTCAGATFPGRVCSGLLTAAGLAELITTTPQDYEALVVTLASDPPRLAALRARVGQAAPASPLFQTAAFARDLESAFRTMYEQSQAGLKPRSFAVSAPD